MFLDIVHPITQKITLQPVSLALTTLLYYELILEQSFLWLDISKVILHLIWLLSMDMSNFVNYCLKKNKKALLRMATKSFDNTSTKSPIDFPRQSWSSFCHIITCTTHFSYQNNRKEVVEYE